MRTLLIHASITFLVVVDPVGLAPIFAGLMHGRNAEDRQRIARMGVLVAAIVLFAFALGGKSLLTNLGVSMPAFRIAGGILLFLVAIDMVFARHTGLRYTTSSEDQEALQRHDISVFPLAIPLIAGPGAIASVMLLMGETAGSLGQQAAVLGVLVAVLALTYIMLLIASRMVALLGVTGTNVVGRVLGIVLAGLAVQFVIDGARAVAGGAI